MVTIILNNNEEEHWTDASYDADQNINYIKKLAFVLICLELVGVEFACKVWNISCPVIVAPHTHLVFGCLYRPIVSSPLLTDHCPFYKSKNIMETVQ